MSFCTSYMRIQTAQSKVGYRKCYMHEYESACVTNGTREVGTLDPLFTGPSPRPSWTPLSMGTLQRQPLYKHTWVRRTFLCYVTRNLPNQLTDSAVIPFHILTKRSFASNLTKHVISLSLSLPPSLNFLLGKKHRRKNQKTKFGFLPPAPPLFSPHLTQQPA